MYLATQTLVPHAPDSPELSGIPRDLQRLYRREREIASIVYKRGLAAAFEVEAALGNAISNAAVRSMLNRLVRKGILTRMRCGKTGTFIYGPALTQLSAREIELRHFAEDFYGGSLAELAAAIYDIFAKQQSSAGAAAAFSEKGSQSAPEGPRPILPRRQHKSS